MLKISDLHVGYASASVLRGVNLAVERGDAVALLGRNGMGKTTLVRALARLTPPDVTGGRIEFMGYDTADMASYEVSRVGLGLVPQGRRVFGSMTVHENLEVVRRDGTENATGERWTVERVYEFFPRLAERARQRASTLSGGEQQMLAIGRALMTNPSLLVMDEPSEGLAQVVLDDIRTRLVELRGSGLAVLVAEQNVEFALELSDRVAILGETGTIVWEGTSEELSAKPEIMNRHLGVSGDA
ncbi:MAG: ABC transporter ATP-binding protein [Actinomycetes bacterium]